jgi:2-polyprenyl-3-methyl-5-hydroxy-6-metoxy-1,4-benzoquinol methylase
MMKLRSSFAYLDILKKYLSPKIDKPKLLDIGCAYGFMLEAARHYNISALGIEISPASKIARKSGFVVYDKPLEELELPSKSFDIITIIDVLEHILPISRFLAKIDHILKDNGVLFIMTPNICGIGAKLLRKRWPHFKPEHIGYFSNKSLSLLLKRNGFILKEIRTGFKYLSIGYIFRHFIQYGRYNSNLFTMRMYGLMPKVLKNMIIKLPTGMIAISEKYN